MTTTTLTLGNAAPPPASALLDRLVDPMPTFATHLRGSPGRSAVEGYIADQFKAVHGAQIHDFMPVLLTMRCNGKLSAVAGLRMAGSQPLFLEQYLEHRVEQVLGVQFGRTVARSGVVEIGNLVATRKGSNYLLFLVLAAILRQLQYDWCVFTATPPVLKVLGKLGIQLHHLCAADIGRLDAGARADWGQYYDQRPVVVAGEIASNVEALQQRLLIAGVLSMFQQSVDRLAVDISATSPVRDLNAPRA